MSHPVTIYCLQGCDKPYVSLEKAQLALQKSFVNDCLSIENNEEAIGGARFSAYNMSYAIVLKDKTRIERRIVVYNERA